MRGSRKGPPRKLYSIVERAWGLGQNPSQSLLTKGYTGMQPLGLLPEPISDPWPEAYARRNTKNNENEQVQIVANHCFSNTNKQHVKQAKKIRENLETRHHRWGQTKAKHYNVCSEKENELLKQESCPKRGITTDKNLQQTKRDKCEQFLTK